MNAKLCKTCALRFCRKTLDQIEECDGESHSSDADADVDNSPASKNRGMSRCRGSGRGRQRAASRRISRGAITVTRHSKVGAGDSGLVGEVNHEAAVLD